MDVTYYMFGKLMTITNSINYSFLFNAYSKQAQGSGFEHQYCRVTIHLYTLGVRYSEEDWHQGFATGSS